MLNHSTTTWRIKKRRKEVIENSLLDDGYWAIPWAKREDSDEAELPKGGMRLREPAGKNIR